MSCIVIVPCHPTANFTFQYASITIEQNILYLSGAHTDLRIFSIPSRLNLEHVHPWSITALANHESKYLQWMIGNNTCKDIHMVSWFFPFIIFIITIGISTSWPWGFNFCFTAKKFVYSLYLIIRTQLLVASEVGWPCFIYCDQGHNKAESSLFWAIASW